jgi:hypothetical protein
VTASPLTRFIAFPGIAIACAFPAGATNLYNPVVSTSGVLDGTSIELDGTLNDSNGDTQPWVAELYVGGGECARFFIATTAFDAKLTVITPSGFVYRDDDSGGSQRPLVEINGTAVAGWYTVQVSHYLGRPQNANFTLKYGRYNFNNNPNCIDQTIPLAAPDEGALAAKPHPG